MSNCLFCKMVTGEIRPDMIRETDDLIAFRDINPQASTHILIVPRKHVDTVNDLRGVDAELVGRMILAAQDIAREEGIAESGYRLVMNCNASAGQTVFHIHLHLLGGRQMSWPPG